jgi:hypothetical protein
VGVGVVGFLGYIYADEIKAILARLSFPLVTFDPIIAIFVGLMIIGSVAFALSAISRLRKKPTHDLTEILLSLEKDGEMWLLGYDHDTWTKHNPEAIKSAVKDKHVKFTFLFFYPQSRVFQHAMESALMEEGSSKTGAGSVDNLRKTKRALGEDQDKIQIKFCDLPPVYSMVIVNPNSEVGAVAHLWPHMYAMLYPDRLWLTYAIDKAEERVEFEKCKTSFKYAYGKSWEDGQPVPSFVETAKSDTLGMVLNDRAASQLTSMARMKFRDDLKLNLHLIGEELEAGRIPPHSLSWEGTEPELKKGLITSKPEYDALDDFAKSLIQCPDRDKPDFDVWSNLCKNHYERLKRLGLAS